MAPRRMFAAKEAVAKALGTGVSDSLWQILKLLEMKWETFCSIAGCCRTGK